MEARDTYPGHPDDVRVESDHNGGVRATIRHAAGGMTLVSARSRASLLSLLSARGGSGGDDDE
jgi:hypothetical protein